MATKKQEKQETQVAILTPKKVRGTATIYACGDAAFIGKSLKTCDVKL